ncbi:hypothetical protein O3P69_013821 [Scylla paramamosain]|uniref:Uncharacterized protein n=1 Tax=Scylla paramamosain TaxID=85552 RepID=A0AAW0SR53_SCYPA
MLTHLACFTTPHLKEGLIASWTPSPPWTTCGSSQTGRFAVGEEPDAPLRGEELRPLPDRPKCTTTEVCNVWHKGSLRYMRTCQKCLHQCLWTRNTGVKSLLSDLP